MALKMSEKAKKILNTHSVDIIAEQYSFIESISDVDGRYLKGEGYLFPDTYDFYIGENASSVLEKLFSNSFSKDILETHFEKRVSYFPKTFWKNNCIVLRGK